MPPHSGPGPLGAHLFYLQAKIHRQQTRGHFQFKPNQKQCKHCLGGFGHFHRRLGGSQHSCTRPLSALAHEQVLFASQKLDQTHVDTHQNYPGRCGSMRAHHHGFAEPSARCHAKKNTTNTKSPRREASNGGQGLRRQASTKTTDV